MSNHDTILHSFSYLTSRFCMTVSITAYFINRRTTTEHARYHHLSGGTHAYCVYKLCTRDTNVATSCSVNVNSTSDQVYLPGIGQWFSNKRQSQRYIWLQIATQFMLIRGKPLPLSSSQLVNYRKHLFSLNFPLITKF